MRSSSALSSLSYTCKFLHDVLQPIRLHCAGDETANPMHFIRRLVSRPDLAAAIKYLHIDNSNDGLSVAEL